MEAFMKTNKTIKLISSFLIILIIFSLTLSLSVGCAKEVSTETGTTAVTDPEADAAFFSFFVALFIMAEGERIKNEKALDKAIQEANEEKKAKAVAEAESFNAEIEAGYDFRKDFLNTVLYGPGGAEYIENERRFDMYVEKMIEIGADAENQDLENQNTSVTTAVQAQEATQTTEKEKVKKGSITLNGTIAEAGELELIIDLDSGDVSGTYGMQWAEDIWPYLSADCGGEVSGKMDLETNAIEANCSGSCTWQDGDVSSFSVSMTGTLSEDSSVASGNGIDQDGNNITWSASK